MMSFREREITWTALCDLLLLPVVPDSGLFGTNTRCLLSLLHGLWCGAGGVRRSNKKKEEYANEYHLIV
jgi:hypothetical protein